MKVDDTGHLLPLATGIVRFIVRALDGMPMLVLQFEIRSLNPKLIYHKVFGTQIRDLVLGPRWANDGLPQGAIAFELHCSNFLVINPIHL